MTGALPTPHSKLCVLIDGNTGTILYERNAHMRRPPASTTKMAACLVLIHDGKLSDTVTAPPGIEKTEESSLHLASGEKISLEDLLYAMMLRSANDTPVAGAYYLCGSIPPFVDKMNDLVKTIGCRDTHFVTPNGLYAPNHYSTPYDLALIARYGLTHSSVFARIVKTQRRKIVRSIHKRDNVVKNTAETFLKVFPGANGVKTGYVRQAGHCFVGSATRNGWPLIAVALNSPSCRSDVMQMLSYGFSNFEPSMVYKKFTPAGQVQLAGVAGAVPVKTAMPLFDVVSRHGAPIASPVYTIKAIPASHRRPGNVRKGELVGSVMLLANGKPIMTTGAVATEPASEALSARLENAVSNGSGSGAGIIIAKLLVGAAIVVAIGLVVLVFYGRTLTKTNRRRRSRVTPNV